MRLKTAITFGKIGTMLLIAQSVLNFAYHLFNAEEFRDYMELSASFLEITGFSFLFIFLSRFYKKISDV